MWSESEHGLARGLLFEERFYGFRPAEARFNVCNTPVNIPQKQLHFRFGSVLRLRCYVVDDVHQADCNEQCNAQKE